MGGAGGSIAWALSNALKTFNETPFLAPFPVFLEDGFLPLPDFGAMVIDVEETEFFNL